MKIRLQRSLINISDSVARASNCPITQCKRERLYSFRILVLLMIIILCYDLNSWVLCRKYLSSHARRTQNTKHKTQNTKHRDQNTEHRHRAFFREFNKNRFQLFVRESSDKLKNWRELVKPRRIKWYFWNFSKHFLSEKIDQLKILYGMCSVFWERRTQNTKTRTQNTDY